MFSPEELFRYSRHLNLPDFDSNDQESIHQAKVLVVGCGGLGSPVLLYLAALGVGTLGLVDNDSIDLSNLQRQILFNTQEIGKSKAKIAADRLTQLNPHLHIEVIEERITSSNALSIVEGYSMIIDGSDNLPTRYLLNDTAILANIPLVHGSIYRYEGQVAVFNYINKEGNRSSNYRDLFPEPPPPSMVPSCAEGGVLGVLPGIIGTLMTNEAIKIIRGLRPELIDKLLIVDAENLEFRKIKIKKRKDNPLTGENPSIFQLIDYELFCDSYYLPIEEIDRKTLESWNQNGSPFRLIDVREKNEYFHQNIGGINIPLSDLSNHLDAFTGNDPIVLLCQSGKRSKKAIAILKEKGFTNNFYNLSGGIEAYNHK
jgi:adenylyltransferase/sulfurtransferase